MLLLKFVDYCEYNDTPLTIKKCVNREMFLVYSINCDEVNE